MKKYSFYCALLCASVLCATAVADDMHEKSDQAQYEHPHRGHGGDGEGFHFPPLEKILSLTDDQKKKLQEIRVKQHSTQQPIEKQIHEAHQALNKAGDANAADAELQPLANQLGALIAQQEVGRIQFHRQVMGVLTPEQKQQWSKWRADHEAEMEKHHHGDAQREKS